MDYYSLLGVKRNASQDDIKKAYRRLAMKHHPDRGGDAATLTKINEAYDTLKDSNKRARYDGVDPRMNPNNFEDVFHDIFSRRPQRRNRDIRIGATLSLKDVMQGKNIVAAYRLFNGKEEAVNVSIPAGVRDGHMLKFSNLGDNSYPGPRGDLLIRVTVKNNQNWFRDGNNLITEQKINAIDLITGCKIQVETVDSKHIQLNIPPGTHNGTKFSITEYGLPDINTGRKGNVYVLITAEIPKLNSEKQRKKLRKFWNGINNES